MSDVLSRVCDCIANVRHPLLLVFVVGILIRIAIAPLSIVYDSEYWALVIRNIEIGQGLYGVEGYYYTPVWGYILGLVAVLQDALLNLGEVAVKVAEIIPIEGMGPYFSSTIPSVAFLYSVKAPLYVFDAALAFAVWYLIRDVTGDDRKAVLGFALAFLSPVLLASTGIIAMPDTISAMFAVLTVILLRQDHPFIAGMTFSLAVLTKFFPAFLIFVLVAYILVRNRDDRRRAVSHVVLAAVGAGAMAAVIFAPQILAGNIAECFQFLSDRTGSGVDSSLLDTVIGLSRIVVYAIVLVISAYAAVVMYRNRDGDPTRVLMKSCLLISALVLVYPPTTQYMVILVPFLAYWIAAEERRFMLSWKIMAVGAVICVFGSNASTLTPLGVWEGWFGIDSLVSFFTMWNDPVLLGLSPRNIQFGLGSILQCLGIVMVLWQMHGDDLLRAIRSRRPGDDSNSRAPVND